MGSKACKDYFHRPKPLGWDDFFAHPSLVPEDFMAERKDLAPQKRELF